jgi:hypothetical protein
VRDLPLDEKRGPYPVVIFVHGTASFRTQSLTQMVHWASRGFVVLSADHPGIGLKDIIGNTFDFGNQSRNTDRLVTAVQSPSGPLAFLAGRIDTARIALSGHSAGGNAIGGLDDRAGVLVRMPLAAGGTSAGAALVSTLVMGGKDDMIVQYSRQKMVYDASPPKKRLVGIANAGHPGSSPPSAAGSSSTTRRRRCWRRRSPARRRRRRRRRRPRPSPTSPSTPRLCSRR